MTTAATGLSRAETGDIDIEPLVGLAAWRLPVSGTSAIEFAAQAGVAGIQLDLGGPGRGEWIDRPGHIAALRRCASDHGIRLLALAGNHLNDVGLAAAASSMAGNRVRALLHRQLDAAYRLGVPLAIVPSFRRSAINGMDALQRTIEVLAWASDQAAECGLQLANENALPARLARRLVRAVGSPVFRLVLDTYNPVAAGLDPAGLVVELSSWFADQLHLKDGLPAAGNTALLGDGNGELAATLAAVGRCRFRTRYLVLENDYRDGDLARVAADIARARRYADGLTTTRIGVEP